MNGMSVEQTEAAFVILSEAIDRVGEAERARFLAKLALLMANELGSPERLPELTEAAARGLGSID